MKGIMPILVLGLAVWPAAASAQPEADAVAGRVLGQLEGRAVELPMLRSDYDVDIQGDLATVTLTQTFENPHDAAMRAEYLFPLNRSAAVYAMTMEIGDEVVRAEIREKNEAKQVFAAAEAEGKAAALLTQHRPNMFIQEIANLMPGLPVTVSLSYVRPVPRIDGAYELVVPLIVGPRYEGAQEAEPPAERVEQAGWSFAPLPRYPLVAGLDLPDHVTPDRVGLDLRLTSAVPVVSLTSATHDLSTEAQDRTVSARFEAGRVIDNRDLVVRYVLGGETVTSGILTHTDERGGFLSLLIEPPAAPAEEDASPREVVFVLDTSGSMGGSPMAASKRFMAAALEGLRPTDHFRIIRFSNSADHFAAEAVPATTGNRLAGLDFVRGLRTGGGTEIDNAIRTAFATRQPPGTLRIVVFLSDGYIGDEATVLRTIRQQIGEARIFAFGVGTAVNRYLLESMAEEGRGYVRYVDPTEDAGEVAETMARDLRTPVLTDIHVDWGDLAVTEVSPARIPDLFAGRQLRLLARYEGGAGQVRISGQAAGRAASLVADVAPKEANGRGTATSEALPLIWARERIADHERALAVREGRSTDHEAAITRLGLAFGLQSRFTSFVAVSERVVNATGTSKPASVALPKVSGVPASAYPRFSGASTPEPETVFGLGVLAMLAAVQALRRRRRAQGLPGMRWLHRRTAAGAS